MIKKLAYVFGIVFVLIGVLGFVSPLAPVGDDNVRRLLGIFAIDGLHNLVHIASGVVALIAASASTKASRLYFQVFGVVYAVVTVVGFIQGDSVLGLIPVNLADNLLHTAIALVALYAGFGMHEDAVAARSEA